MQQASVDRPAWSARVGSLVRPPVTCTTRTTVAEAAALMARERTSWVLIDRLNGCAMVTERDLTTRILAAGRSATTSVGDIAKDATTVVPSDRPVADVFLDMLESNQRHIAVADARARILGVVSAGDLVAVPWRPALELRSAIECAESEDAVIAAGRELPRTVVSLMDATVDPLHVSRAVALAIEVMTRRLLDLAIDRLGTPPVPWAWLSLGSAARREQATNTDQDHALAFDLREGSLEEVDDYFLRLAGAVTSKLDAAGIPRCHANVVAENRSLRRPLEHWVQAFTEWIDDPRLSSGRQASILFDLRRSAGPLEAERTLEAVIGTAREHPRFVDRLAMQAVDTRPPRVRWRGRTIADGDAFDVKRSGLTPIVNLARSYAVETGIVERATLDRLAASAARGRISGGVAADLSEAFRVLWRVRLEHHVELLDAGRPVDDLVDIRTIRALQRVQLTEACRIVRDAQRALRRDHGLRRSDRMFRS